MSSSDHAANSEPTDALVDARSRVTAPEAPVKRATAAVLAAVLLISLLLPWWRTQYEFREALGGPLHGWQLILLGFGGAHADLSGLSVIGRVALGLVPTLPLLVLAALLTVRAIWPRAITAPIIAIWAVLEALAIGWLQVLGWVQLNQYLGEHPAMFGSLVAIMATLFALVAFLNWWRRGEREHFEMPEAGADQPETPAADVNRAVDGDELTDDAGSPGRDTAEFRALGLGDAPADGDGKVQ